MCFGNVFLARSETQTNNSIIGTSVNTPTTVASAAPEATPKRVVVTAMATSKWLLPAMMAAGIASPYFSLIILAAK